MEGGTIMGKWKVAITDADIDAALEDAKDLPPEPSALSGEYVPTLDVDHYLPHLLVGKYSSERWKQSRKQQPVAA
jgi:hypothetical protein